MKCFKFSAYNSQAMYGWGSEAEAQKFAAHLNHDREINVYSYSEVEDAEVIAELEAGYHDQVNLDDELAALAGIR